MPALSLRSFASVTGRTAAVFRVGKPAGTAEGDLLLAFQANGSRGVVLVSPNPPVRLFVLPASLLTLFGLRCSSNGTILLGAGRFTVFDLRASE